METLNLNLIPTGANPVAHVSQYDEGRVIRFNLFEGSAVYTLDGTETIECDVKKPDGNVVTLGVTNTSDSYVEVTTTLQTCACAGESLADIKITKGAVVIATLNFILDVERSPLENGIESDSAIHNLETQIAEAVADQYDADSVIFDNTPTAGHGIGYAVTSEGILNAIPENIDDLSDVTITSPQEGEALVFDENGNLVNGTVSTVGELNDLTDVSITSAQQGDSLRNDGNGNWINEPTTIAMTQDDWDDIQDKSAWRNAHKNTHLVLTDSPNLNATSQDLSYDGGATSTHDVIEGIKDYSTSERAVGKWIDGSTIYEKTVDFGTQVTLTNGAWNTVTGFSETIQPIQVICFDTTNKIALNSIFARSNSNQLQLRPFTGGNENVTGYIIRYTK